MIREKLLLSLLTLLLPHQVAFEVPLGILLRRALLVVEAEVLTDTRSLPVPPSRTLTRVRILRIWKGKCGAKEIDVLGLDHHAAHYRAGESVLLTLGPLPPDIEGTTPPAHAALQGKREKLLLTPENREAILEFVRRYLALPEGQGAAISERKDLLVETLSTPIAVLRKDAFLELMQLPRLDRLLSRQDVPRLLPIIGNEAFPPLERIALLAAIAPHLRRGEIAALAATAKEANVREALVEVQAFYFPPPPQEGRVPRGESLTSPPDGGDHASQTKAAP
ncbi:MAG: hypothetical protein D6812_00745 [Deltaproteobacteria bacterium]|nr:MAG: hypothetical protein D6812_00745 [Deltaproteobacteria bacterium]